ncbi:MAG TPA: GNAT family N-acetyltransferase [Spongiibacteraceae bacterium]|nr:GNAT family N-acetyltransferase [Spongiibacteraceae bacterium]
MKIELIDSLAHVAPAEWNEITGIDYPFTRHEFLFALEDSGAANADSGWQASHVLVRRNNNLIAVMPLYEKNHSYGEYVFDWSWADAYRRYGYNYYPKLICAIPFTPSTGPRLCIRAGENYAEIATAVIEFLKQKIGRSAYSSLHILFPQQAETAALGACGLSERSGVQYHWRNDNYADFDAFLATFNSRKRKGLRRERERVAAQGLTLRVLEGEQISVRDWELFHHFYQMTYAKRSGHRGYLNAKFFRLIGAQLKEHIVLTFAELGDKTVAGALYFRDSQTLYGRYWGCLHEFDGLHFEACYYQGIEYCIRNGLQRFDPGAQGEHKIQRGFAPVATRSYHWIENPQFRAAIDNFLTAESTDLERYIEEASTLLPFRKEE